MVFNAVFDSISAKPGIEPETSCSQIRNVTELWGSATILEIYLQFSSNLKLSSANPFNLEEYKICRLGKGLQCYCLILTYIPYTVLFLNQSDGAARMQQRFTQRVLPERPRLVSDHFYSAISITFPNINEAEDSGHLIYMLYFQDNHMLLVLICIVSIRRFK